MKEKDMHQCLVEGISHRGEGIARIEGIVTFIPYAIPGENVACTVTEKSRRFQRARLEKVLQPSPCRSEPPCPYYFDCGGCDYQHVSYESELRFKRQVVLDNLKHLGSIEAEVMPVMGMESPWHYRNKATFHLKNVKGQNTVGYYQAESNRIISVDRCLLISPAMQTVFQNLKLVLGELEPLKGQVIIRQDSNGRILVLLQTPVLSKKSQQVLKQSLETENLLWQDDNKQLHIIKGQPWLEEKIGPLRYRLSPLAFFQVNRQQCQVLYDQVKSQAQLDEAKKVLDAYCGTGTIALYLAGEAGEVLGVEAFAPAIEDAKFNAGLNGITNFGIAQLRTDARRIFGDRQVPWFVSYRVRVAVK
jgi:23S rRNA (uracil1939-C5)-methyltransferase